MSRYLIVAVALSLFPARALAQPDAEPVHEISLVETQLQLNATLVQIRDVLARQLEGQDLRLLLDRSRLAGERAERLETRLRSAQAERRGLDAERASLETQREVMRESAEVAGDEEEIARVDALDRQFQVELDRIRARVRSLDLELVELENRLASEREDAEGWQDVVDRRLGGL